MPKVKANGISIHYEQEGSGDPLLLIPYLSADHTCYALHVAEYAKHFTCISIDLRGAGESDKPDGVYSTELFADDVAAFMQATETASAHVMGVSLGGAVGMWLAAKYPDKVRSLSLHGAWHKSDAFQIAVIESWRVLARALNNVPEMVIQGIFPWCFTPEFYEQHAELIAGLTDFVRSRPAQPLGAFLQQSNAGQTHDVSAQLERITAPTQITVGQYDMVTSLRFARPMQERIRNAELVVFEGCAHTPGYEKPEEFHQRTLEFLRGRAAARAA